MNQDKVFEATIRAVEAPLAFTRKVMGHSKRLRHPSKKINKIGSAIGSSIGVGLILAGGVGLIMGKTLWATSSVVAGAATVVSNVVSYHKRKSN